MVSRRIARHKCAIVTGCWSGPIDVRPRSATAIQIRQDPLIGAVEIDEGQLIPTVIGMRQRHPGTEGGFHLFARATPRYAEGAIRVHGAIVAFPRHRVS
jgi:hypothetical protein